MQFLLDQIPELLTTTNTNEIKTFLNSLEQEIRHNNNDISLDEAQTKMLYRLMCRTIHDQRIGDIILQEYLQRNKRLSPLSAFYSYFKEKENLGITKFSAYNRESTKDQDIQAFLKAVEITDQKYGYEATDIKRYLETGAIVCFTSTNGARTLMENIDHKVLKEKIMQQLLTTLMNYLLDGNNSTYTMNQMVNEIINYIDAHKKEMTLEQMKANLSQIILRDQYRGELLNILKGNLERQKEGVRLNSLTKETIEYLKSILGTYEKAKSKKSSKAFFNTFKENGSYNYGKPVLGIENFPLEERNEALHDFAEGSEKLENCLQVLWDKGLRTIACCKGAHLSSKTGMIENDSYIAFDSGVDIFSYLSIEFINNEYISLEEVNQHQVIRYYGKNKKDMAEMLVYDVLSGKKLNNEALKNKVNKEVTDDIRIKSHGYSLQEMGFSAPQIAILNELYSQMLGKSDDSGLDNTKGIKEKKPISLEYKRKLEEFTKQNNMMAGQNKEVNEMKDSQEKRDNLSREKQLLDIIEQLQRENKELRARLSQYENNSLNR